MKITNIKNILNLYLENTAKSNRVLAAPLLRGLPGIGKTAMVEAIAEEKDYDLVVVQLGSKTLDYFFGLPEKEGQDTLWTRPGLIVEIDSKAKPVIVLLDDIHLASTETRKILFEFLTHWTIHGFKPHNQFKIILAGNPAEAEYGNTEGDLPEPVKNRVFILDVEFDFDYWIQLSEKAGVNRMILEFLKDQPEYVSSEPDENGNGQFASPRAWWNLSDYLNFGIDPTHEFVAAFVGTIVANEFMKFVEVFKQMKNQLPSDYSTLSYKDKSNFIEFLMTEKDKDLIRKYLKDIVADKETKPLAVKLCQFIAEDPDLAELLDIVPLDFLSNLS